MRKYLILIAAAAVFCFAGCKSSNEPSTAGEWITYTKENSGFVGEGVTDIAIDNNNNVWIGTDIGISLYKQGK